MWVGCVATYVYDYGKVRGGGGWEGGEGEEGWDWGGEVDAVDKDIAVQDFWEGTAAGCFGHVPTDDLLTNHPLQKNPFKR